MKILLISPKDKKSCGVADYSHNLYESFSMNSELKIYFEQIDFNFFTLKKINKYIKKINPDVINLQYPSPIYSKNIFSILPYLFLSFLYPLTVTLHEFSQSHFLRKLAIIFLCLLSKKIFLTNESEKLILGKIIFWKKNNFIVIPIASNIPKSKKKVKKSKTICYFGLIRPKKGLEEFIDLAKESEKNLFNLKFLIIGSTPPHFSDYSKKIIEIASNCKNIEIKLNLDEISVADEMYKCQFAYLIYPDGISDRRGSFLASVNNSLIVVSNKGKFTTQEIESFCYLNSKKIDILNFIFTIKDNEIAKIIEKSNIWIESRSWLLISNLYLENFKSIL